MITELKELASADQADHKQIQLHETVLLKHFFVVCVSLFSNLRS